MFRRDNCVLLNEKPVNLSNENFEVLALQPIFLLLDKEIIFS